MRLLFAIVMFVDSVFIIDFHRCLSPPGICRVAITVLHVTLRCTYFVYTPVHDAQIHGFNPWFVCMGMNALHKCRRESETFSNAQFHERPQGRFYMLKSTVVHVQSAHIKVVCRGGIAWSLCGHCGATSAVYSSPFHRHTISNDRHWSR